MGKARIEWIDCYKGLLILLVVYGHFCQNIEINGLLGPMFTTFFMAAFFVISGYVTSLGVHRGGGGILTVCINRCTRLLIPSIVLTPFLLAHTAGSFSGIYDGGLKLSYWFTVTLFEIYVIFALLVYLYEKWNIEAKWRTIIFLVVMTISEVIHIIFIAKKPDIYNGLPGLLMVGNVVHYIPYFFLGVLMKIYNERFMKFIENNVVMSMLFVFWILGMIGRLYMEKMFHLYWTLPILSTIGVLCLFRFFKSFSETFSSGTTVGRFMILLGKNSLQIYLLHWFFLKELQKLDWSSITPQIESTIVTEIIVVGIVSVVISYLCILVDRFLKPYPIVHGLFLGFDGRKKAKLNG